MVLRSALNEYSPALRLLLRKQLFFAFNFNPLFWEGARFGKTFWVWLCKALDKRGSSGSFQKTKKREFLTEKLPEKNAEKAHEMRFCWKRIVEWVCNIHYNRGISIVLCTFGLCRLLSCYYGSDRCVALEHICTSATIAPNLPCAPLPPKRAWGVRTAEGILKSSNVYLTNSSTEYRLLFKIPPKNQVVLNSISCSWKQACCWLPGSRAHTIFVNKKSSRAFQKWEKWPMQFLKDFHLSVVHSVPTLQ